MSENYIIYLFLILAFFVGFYEEGKKKKRAKG